ncbi:hypothetical protein M885DRAFT_585006 [Pelagophyceae sp. CCMP2097]|nr:hypothetical protein M885DRAFT_585006 [Pelagophyceae sp. CCMP2097]
MVNANRKRRLHRTRSVQNGHLDEPPEMESAIRALETGLGNGLKKAKAAPSAAGEEAMDLGGEPPAPQSSEPVDDADGADDADEFDGAEDADADDADNGGEDGDDDDGDDGGDDDDYPTEPPPMRPFDLHATLGVRPHPKGGVVGGDSKCFANYHVLSLRHEADRQAYADRGWRTFRDLAVAFVVLRDAERREIYDRLGFQALAQSEAYSEHSVLDVDPHAVFDAFFDGREYDSDEPCDEIKEYLLLEADGGGRDNYVSCDEQEEEEDDELDMPPLQPAGKQTRLGGDAPMPVPPAAVILAGGVSFGPMSAQFAYPGSNAWRRLQTLPQAQGSKAA